MNKKEQQAFLDLESQLRLARAFRWTDKPEPDVLPPSLMSDGVATGWDYNAHAPWVQEAWTTSISHGTGERSRCGGSQNSRKLYSTKLLALKALRADLEMICAKKIADIDKLIEAENPA